MCIIEYIRKKASFKLNYLIKAGFLLSINN